MKLSPAQMRVLKTLVNYKGPALDVWALGRRPCEALRKRGLVEAGVMNNPITRFNNPYIYITKAGRDAVARMRQR